MSPHTSTVLDRIQAEPERSWQVIDFMIGTSLSAGQVALALTELYVAGLVDQPATDRYQLAPRVVACEVPMELGDVA